MRIVRGRRLRIWPVILWLAALLVLIGCQGERKDGSLERVRAAGELAIAIDPSYPPFAAIDQRGQPIGYEIDLADELSKRLGVAPHFVGMDVGGIIDALIARKIDVVISGIPPVNDKGRRLAYSRPYFNAGQVLLAGPNGPETVAGLAGRLVGVESGSGGDLELRRLAREVSGLAVRSYTTPHAALDDVSKGRIDAAVADIVTASELVPQYTGLKVASIPLTDEFYVVAGRREDPSLMAAIDAILAELDREGYLAELSSKWLPGLALGERFAAKGEPSDEAAAR